MGYLHKGIWHTGWYDTAKTGGDFVRETSRFRAQVTADGAGGFRAEPGRYHLYVSAACPWAHRTLIFRTLKRLENVIDVTVVDPIMGDDGWHFADAAPDPVHGARFLREIYLLADPRYSGRVTVPVLWDKQQRTIVSNESADILRMFNRAFDAFTDIGTDYYPVELQAAIDDTNRYVYETINNGVYRCGFATTQASYDRAFEQLFAALDDIDQRLAHQRYIVGDRLTEADWRLFTTLVRFDAVYYGHFKCNRQRLIDYPHLWPYVRELYQVPGVAATVNFDHIKRHYYMSHRHINPTGIVPRGPAVDFSLPHDRHRLAAAPHLERTPEV